MLWHGTARHAKREGGVYAHYVCASLVQNAVWTCCAYVQKCEKGVCVK